MSPIVLLFIIGLILIGFEVIVPGGILGAMGGVAMLAGVVLAFTDHGARGGLVALLVALALVGVTLYVEFGLLPKTSWGRSLFLTASIKGTSQRPDSGEAAALVGQTAVALTTLAPSGYVRVGSQRYEAFCQAGFVERGAPLRVVGLDNFRLIVTKS